MIRPFFCLVWNILKDFHLYGMDVLFYIELKVMTLHIVTMMRPPLNES
jgi:hypothetical protein